LFFPLFPFRAEPSHVASHPSRSLSLALSQPTSLLKKKNQKRQAIVITDPALATHVCRSKLLDKFRFQYHFMDEVRREEDVCFFSLFEPSKR